MENQEQQQNQGAQEQGDGNIFANDGFGAQQDDARQDRDRRGEVPPPPDGAQPGEQQQAAGPQIQAGSLLQPGSPQQDGGFGGVIGGFPGGPRPHYEGVCVAGGLYSLP